MTGIDRLRQNDHIGCYYKMQQHITCTRDQTYSHMYVIGMHASSHR